MYYKEILKIGSDPNIRTTVAKKSEVGTIRGADKKSALFSTWIIILIAPPDKKKTQK